MFEKIKEIKRLTKQVKQSSAPEYDENGLRVINVTVNNDDGFLSPFCNENKPTLSAETASFLEHDLKNVKPKERVKIVIKSRVIDGEEKKIYSQAVKNYYLTKAQDVRTELKRNAVLSLIMLFIGIVIFSAIIILTAINQNALVLNVLDVVAWVFIWEAVDLFAFKRAELNSEQLLNLKLLNTEITFAEQI